MKKFFMLMAAAVFAFAACEKTPDTGTPGGDDPVEDALELHLDVNVQLQHEVNTNYSGTTATLDGEKILEFFELENDDAFYTAMGSIENGGQINNTLMFGICVEEDGEWVYTFNPSTSANFGHWMTKEGVMTTWGSEEAPQYFFTENQYWWGYESIKAADDACIAEYGESIGATIWDFTVGMEAGYYDLNVGDKLSAVEFIFEEETGKTLYIHWNIEIVDAIVKTYNVLETVTSTMTIEYNNTYAPIPVTGFDYAAISAKLGVADAFKDCDIYPLSAEGKFAFIPSADNWFGADGNVSGWGDNAIFDFKYDSTVAADNFTLFCMPYNPEAKDAEGNVVPQTAADKCGTFTASVAFVNAKDEAVVLKLTLTITEPQAWDGEIVKTYDLTCEFTHNNDWYGAAIELNADEITAAIGVAPVDAKMLGSNKFAATDLYFANEAGVDLLNIYYYEGEFIAAPIALSEGEDVASRCGTATGTFYLVNGNKGVQVNVTATITAPTAE